ncbi:MAG: FAD-dependent oxidoreductase [Hyphomicrobiaceae bacterium]
MSSLQITVVGAGIFGLWQAFELARRGHDVTLREALPEAESGGSSRFAGAMLAPYCEAEGAEPIIQELGLEGLELWRAAFSHVVQNGSLVLVGARDLPDLRRFERLTQGHRHVDQAEIGELEPDLAGRFGRGLFFPTEGHVSTRKALAALREELRRLGVAMVFANPVGAPIWTAAPAGGLVIDCRGIAARTDLPELRGVRGEMALVRTREVSLSRPIRLLHPRFPLYVVPWGDDTYMIGATVIEREDFGAVTVRSALDLLGTAYAVHPAFGEAEVIEMSAGVRPAFPDNVPKVVVGGRRIHVNGAYRHGYLFAPVMARITADFLETGKTVPGIVVEAPGNSASASA